MCPGMFRLMIHDDDVAMTVESFSRCSLLQVDATRTHSLQTLTLLSEDVYRMGKSLQELCFEPSC